MKKENKIISAAHLKECIACIDEVKNIALNEANDFLRWQYLHEIQRHLYEYWVENHIELYQEKEKI